MKTKLKKYLKLGILLFGISVLLTNCEKNDGFVEIETQKERKVNRISFSNFKTNIIQNAQYKSLSKYFDLNAKSTQNTQSKIEADDDFIVLTDEVLMIQNDDIVNYTFKILTESENNEFYNLIVHVNGQQEIIKSEIYEYSPTVSWLSDTSQPYSGYLKVVDNDIISTDNLFDAKSGGICATHVTGEWECSYGYNHAPGGCNASSFEFVYTTHYGPCPNEPIDDGIYLEEGSENGGGGSTPDSGSTSTIPTTSCDSQNTGFTVSNGSCLDANEYALQNAIEEDPFLLLEIDCNQIQKWQTLAQHDAPQNVKTKISNLPSTFYNDFEIQLITDANGTIVNMDYFPVKVTTLPNNPLTGQQFTADEFLDYFRRNLNVFAAGGGSEFEPYCNIPTMCQTETDLWNSNSPLGTIIYIDIPADDGVVVCTEYTDSYWYFMTMNAPYAGNHPVSGTRQFGYEINLDGSYNFFVRGVDRFNSFIQSDVAQAFSGVDPFLAADFLWVTFQQNMNNFINNNGGSSTSQPLSKNRPNWNKVKDVLLGNKPISDLGCE